MYDIIPDLLLLLLLSPAVDCQVIHGSIMEDRERVLESSKAMGFLTGYESKVQQQCYVTVEC